MSITLEFYSAQPEMFIQQIEKWFDAETDEDSDLQLDKLYALYPHSDFSFHLQWPSDIDSFCQALVFEGLDVPSTCTTLLVKEMWSDDISTWIDLISPKFPIALSNISDNTIKYVVEDWIKKMIPEYVINPEKYTFIYNNIFKALLELRLVSQDVLKYNKNMLLFRVW